MFLFPQFPFCNDDQAISVACLDLHYSVTTRVGKQLKDEKKDNFAPIVLSDLSPEDELNGSEEGDVQEEEQECDGGIIYLFTCLLICLFTYLFVCLLLTCLFSCALFKKTGLDGGIICLLTCLFTYLFVYLFVYLLLCLVVLHIISISVSLRFAAG